MIFKSPLAPFWKREVRGDWAFEIPLSPPLRKGDLSLWGRHMMKGVHKSSQKITYLKAYLLFFGRIPVSSIDF